MAASMDAILGGLSQAQSAKLAFGITYVALLYLGCVVFLFFFTRGPAFGQRADVRRLGAVLFLLMFIFYALLSARTSRVIIPNGDEPFYLLAAVSALEDHDLNIADNFQRGEWRSFMPERAELTVWPSPRADGKIFLEERVVFIWFVAFWYALGKVPGVAMGMSLVSAVFVFLIFRLLFSAGFSAQASFRTALAAGFMEPLVTMGARIYHNTLGATLILGVFLLVTAGRRSIRNFIVCLAIVCLLPWIHASYAVFSVTLFLVLVRAYRFRFPYILSATLAGVSSAGLFLWYRQLIRYGMSLGVAGEYALTPHIYRSLAALFFDQEGGLFFHAPVYILSLCGLSCAYFVDRARRLVGGVFFLLSGYLVLQGSLPAFGGGFDTGRLLMPMVPFLVLFLARFLQARKTPRLFLGLLGISLVWGFVLSAVPWLAVNYEVGTHVVLRALERLGLSVYNFLPAFNIRGREHYFVIGVICAVCFVVGAREERKFLWQNFQ